VTVTPPPRKVRRFVLLPGMHGTTPLFDAFIASAPPGGQIEPVTLPAERLTYSALAARLAGSLSLTPDTVLIAESFSGPLAILLAERFPVAALILCNSFAAHPYPKSLAALPLSLFARVSPPAAIVRHYIVGPDASDLLVSQVRRTVAAVPVDILAFRARITLRVDVTAHLARCKLPILYMRGTEDNLVREKSVQEIVEAATVPVSVAYLAAPHLLLKTSPRESWRTIEEFMARARAF